MDKKLTAEKSREISLKIIKFQKENKSRDDRELALEFSMYIYENGADNIPKKFSRIMQIKL